jgi:hypothetical protein
LVIVTARQCSKLKNRELLQGLKKPLFLHVSILPLPLCSSTSGGTTGPSLSWRPTPLQWWPPSSLPQLLSLSSSSSSPPLRRACLAYLGLFPLTQRYSIYQPNTILHISRTDLSFYHPPRSSLPTSALPSVVTVTTGLGGSQQRTSRPPGGGLDSVRRRDTWPQGGGDECR